MAWEPTKDDVRRARRVLPSGISDEQARAALIAGAGKAMVRLRKERDEAVVRGITDVGQLGIKHFADLADARGKLDQAISRAEQAEAAVARLRAALAGKDGLP